MEGSIVDCLVINYGSFLSVLRTGASNVTIDQFSFDSSVSCRDQIPVLRVSYIPLAVHSIFFKYERVLSCSMLRQLLMLVTYCESLKSDLSLCHKR